MLRPLTNLDMVNRFDVEVDPALIADGKIKTGTWVVKRGDTLVIAEDAQDAMQVWTEDYRDGQDKLTPNASALHTTQLTVLFGKMRALTDQYKGTPTVGTKLKVDTDGQLVAIDTGEEALAVAVCTKAQHSERHLWKDHDVIEILTF